MDNRPFLTLKWDGDLDIKRLGTMTAIDVLVEADFWRPTMLRIFEDYKSAEKQIIKEAKQNIAPVIGASDNTKESIRTSYLDKHTKDEMRQKIYNRFINDPQICDRVRLTPEVTLKSPVPGQTSYVRLVVPRDDAVLLEVDILSAANSMHLPVNINLHKSTTNGGRTQHSLISMGPLCPVSSPVGKGVILQETLATIPSMAVRDATTNPINRGRIDLSMLSKVELISKLDSLAEAETYEEFVALAGDTECITSCRPALVRIKSGNIFYELLKYPEIISQLRLVWTPMPSHISMMTSGYPIVVPFFVLFYMLENARRNTVTLRRLKEGQDLALSYTPVDLSKYLHNEDSHIEVGNKPPPHGYTNSISLEIELLCIQRLVVADLSLALAAVDRSF
jgi:hypothetical protein